MFLDNLLSIVIFIPLIAAAILGLFLRGNDEAAQQNAKYVALAATLLDSPRDLLASERIFEGSQGRGRDEEDQLR